MNYKRTLSIGLLTLAILSSCAQTNQPLRLNIPGNNNTEKLLCKSTLIAATAFLCTSFVIIPCYMFNKSSGNGAAQSNYNSSNSFILTTLKPDKTHQAYLEHQSARGARLEEAADTLTSAIQQFEGSGSTSLEPLTLGAPIDNELESDDKLPAQDSNSILMVPDDSDPIGGV